MFLKLKTRQPSQTQRKMKKSSSDKKLATILEHPTLTPREKNEQGCALIREVKSDSLRKDEIKGLYWTVCRYGTVEQLHLLVHDFQGLYYGWTLGSYMIRVLALHNRIDLILYLAGKLEINGFTFNPHQRHVFYSYASAITEVVMTFFQYNYVSSILTLLRNGIHMFEVSMRYIHLFTPHKYHFRSIDDYYRYIQNRLESYPSFNWDALFDDDEQFDTSFLSLIHLPYIQKRFDEWLVNIRRPLRRETVDDALRSHLSRDLIRYEVLHFLS